MKNLKRLVSITIIFAVIIISALIFGIIYATLKNSSKNTPDNSNANVKYYTITFNKIGNAATTAYQNKIEFSIESIKEKNATIIDLSQYIPTWAYNVSGLWHHYEFKGWSLTLGGDIVSQIIVTQDITLYANWNSFANYGKN